MKIPKGTGLMIMNFSFNNSGRALTSDTHLTIPNTKHPFSDTISASLIGLAAVLFQFNEANETKIISEKTKIFCA